MLVTCKKNTVSEPKRPRIVEIIGPAGAGKTTLCKLLTRRCGIHLSQFPDVRKVMNAPFFILYGLRLAPILAHISRCDGGRLSRREFAWLIILNGWPKVLLKELKGSSDVILLDQGPVYLLSEISGFGPKCLKERRIEQVWQMCYRQWAATLDAIVWLDAADEVLLKRIRNRKKEHVIKAESAHAVCEFLQRYRNAYEHTLSKLSVNRMDLKVFRFDTTQQAPEVIVNQLLGDLF